MNMAYRKENPLNNLLIKALRQEPVPRTPIWVMRQAGRYLPAYRAMREKYDFLDMVYTPEIAAEVTAQPVEMLDFDAAIFFSDILVIPQAMGMELEFTDGAGPVFPRPLRHFSDLEILRDPLQTDMLQPILEGIRLARARLEGHVPLIGFAGAPWTLAAYMLEGRGSKNFRFAKAALYEQPEAMDRLLEMLSAAVSGFLLQQIDAGAQAVQIFDSWAGFLTPAQFRRFALPALQKIVDRVKPSGVPVIVFARGASHSLDQLAETGADALGIDWQTEMQLARRIIGGRAAVQGNLDPVALFAPLPVLRREVKRVFEQTGEMQGHVFNLGHGILPDTPVDHVRALIQYVHELSPQFRAQAAGCGCHAAAAGRPVNANISANAIDRPGRL